MYRTLTTILKAGHVIASLSPVHSLHHAEHHSLPMQMVKEKLEYWIEKYNKDTAAKDEELHDLRSLKAENFETMQRYAKEVRHQQHLNVQPCKIGLFPTLIQMRNQDHGKKNSNFEA